LGVESPNRGGAQSGAVFLSYASQDAAAAQRICQALRAAGIEVWFDQSELRGGDAWDQKIRREIHDCALFIPVVSQHTQERLEGYFRHEWKLAIERAHHMAEEKAFLVPIVVDATRDQDAIVPDLFRAVQWTRLPGGATPPEFAARISRLLSVESPTATMRAAGAASGSSPFHPTAGRPLPFRRALPVVVAALVLAALAYLLINKPWISGAAGPLATSNGTSPAVPAAFNPPPHSIAVLPFVNISGDKEQEYFSDGLTEELLNSLAEIDGLQVAGRTSSFYFKGKDVDLGTVAHKLNVGAVLEGSVRRSGNTVRITTQLINAVTGFHVWSHAYDRDLGDVLKLETEIAGAVANALKVSLLGDAVTRIELGGTRNPAAFDAYLRGMKLGSVEHGAKESLSAIAAFTEAIGLDPSYALAFAGRSMSHTSYAQEFASGAATREYFAKGRADAHRALELAPDLAEGHMAMGFSLTTGSLDFRQAAQAYERARALASGNARVLRTTGTFAVTMGRFDRGLSDLRRAVTLDPLDPRSHGVLGIGLYLAGHYQEAAAALTQAISLDPDDENALGWRGLAYYALGDLEKARSSCETKPDYWGNEWCLALVYHRLGRQADAEAAVGKIKAPLGDAAAYQYATIYAQWGNTSKAFEWLDIAMRLRDPGLSFLKDDPLVNPLRNEPRFQAIERELKFPD
jgi:TolB-like protein/Flp pilus assembly protein TadD